MARAALGADPIKVVGIHDTSGGLDIYGQSWWPASNTLWPS